MKEVSRTNRAYYMSRFMSARGIYKNYFIKKYQPLKLDDDEKLKLFLDEMCKLTIVSRFCGDSIKKIYKLNALIKKNNLKPVLILDKRKHYDILQLEQLFNGK